MNQDPSRPRRRTSESQPPRGASNVNSTLSIIIAVLAVLLGFFILRDIRSDQSGQTLPAESNNTVAPTDTTPVEVPVATTLVLTAFKIQVANASGMSGTAGQLTTELQGRGYIVQPAMNKSEITPKQTMTVVYYLLGSEAAAAAVASELGGVGIAAMPEPIPTETGKLGEASVLILLGSDIAGKPLGTGAAAVVPVAPTTTTG
ncbi:MAG: LytR C-terminal domain-containing protein [Ilumatobacteraceae bacterium]|nr:LytR C-terminal domain-containing protein [Ilumatobacteraceae bacterium]